MRPVLTLNRTAFLLRLCRQLERHLERGFQDHHDLTLEQVLVLLQVAYAHGDSRPSTATGLGDSLAMPHAKKVIKALINRGLVDPDAQSPWRDGRRKPLRLTEAGQKAVIDLGTTYADIYKTAFNRVPSPALIALSSVLGELQDVPAELARAFKVSQ